MRQKLWAPLIFVGLTSLALAAPKGIVPRAASDRYRTHKQGEGFAVGAELLKSGQVQKVFVSDITRCCLVVEVAFYPEKDRPLALSLDDFLLQAADTDTGVKPYSAKLVAAVIQKKADSGRNVEVTQSAGVGYESGTYIDPITGQPTKVHGVTTQVGESVSTGPRDPQSISADQDREATEIELTAKGLPEGSSAAPVAGFLYFPLSVKKKKNTPLQLSYSTNGKTVELALP